MTDGDRPADEQDRVDKEANAPSARTMFATAAEYFQPANWLNNSMALTRNLMEIGLGTSEIAPDKKDWRFQHETWTANPFYKRLSQSYLALSDAIEGMIPDDLPADSKVRAELVAAIITSSLSPTNVLAGNPAAISKTLASGGANLSRGAAALFHDMIHNGGLPQQVDDSAFEVGRNLAVTPGQVVLQTPMFELIQYRPSTGKVKEKPVLLIPPQIGRYYFTDLAPGRSFAEYVVGSGLQYFAVSWRNPSVDEGGWSLEDYLSAVQDAIDAVLEITSQPKLNVVGFCAGGIMSALTSALLATRGRDSINTLTLCVTMLNFVTDAALGAFRFPALLKAAKAQSAAKGILAGDDLHKVFTWLRPNDLVWNYWVNNYLMGEAPPAFDILAWNKDSTNMPARLHDDFLALFEANTLIEADGYKVFGDGIDLKSITCDSFIVGAITDHLTPWKACYEASQYLGGQSTFALSNGGHVAALVNPPGNPKAFHLIGAATAANADLWEGGATRLPGSWWESWTEWCKERSGATVKAPAVLGSARYRSLFEAPGTYVRS